MASIIEITDLKDPQLRPFTSLTEAQLRNRLEPEQGIFIAESPNVIALALEAGCRPRALLMERKHITGKAKEIIERCGDVPVYTAESAVLEGLTGFPLTRGVLCAMGRPQPKTVAEVCQDANRVVILDGLVDATNVGTIFRCAAALHMDAVLVTERCCDPLCRRAVRVSMGTIFQIPWATLSEQATPYPEQLKGQGFQTAAMALHDNAKDIDDPSLVGMEKLAIILGSEGYGLPATTIEACDHIVRIPMSHKVDSLNVAAASAVAFWQLRASKD